MSDILVRVNLLFAYLKQISLRAGKGYESIIPLNVSGASEIDLDLGAKLHDCVQEYVKALEQVAFLSFLIWFSSFFLKYLSRDVLFCSLIFVG